MQATAGQVVTYGGQPVTTYFFSTSGGETEDVENSFVGSQPKPWLKAVDDPFDSVSPKHRWGPYRFTATQVQRKLHRYLQGRFKRIKVLAARRLAARRARAGRRHRRRDERDRAAAALGLRALRHVGLLHLGDLEGEQAEAQASPRPTPATPARPTGGVSPVARAAAARASRLEGTIAPARVGRWLRVERREGTRWVDGHRREGPARRALLGRRARAGGLPRGVRAGRGAVRAGFLAAGSARGSSALRLRRCAARHHRGEAGRSPALAPCGTVVGLRAATGGNPPSVAGLAR